MGQWTWFPEAQCVVTKQPFAQGQGRTCHWGVYRTGHEGWQRVVFKKFKQASPQGSGSSSEEARCCSEVEKSVVADLLARQFNKERRPVKPVEYLMPQMVKIADEDAF